MGTICILLGIIVLLVFTTGGYFIASKVIIGNSTVASLLGLAQTGNGGIYAICIGTCFVIGLLICLNLVMHGLTYNKLCKLDKKVARFGKNHG